MPHCAEHRETGHGEPDEEQVAQAFLYRLGVQGATGCRDLYAENGAELRFGKQVVAIGVEIAELRAAQRAEGRSSGALVVNVRGLICFQQGFCTLLSCRLAFTFYTYFACSFQRPSNSMHSTLGNDASLAISL